MGTDIKNETMSGIPELGQDVPYLKAWELERSVDLDGWRQWLDMRPLLSIYLSIFYLTLIFGGQRVMKSRKPFVLREMLAVWNFVLAAFSVVGFIRTAPELIYVIKQGGFHASVCARDKNITTAFWGLLITLSKAVELMDTGFLVLKKKPLTFLSWGHHTIALMATFLGYSTQSSSWRWFTIMNLFVHSIMYTYFGLKTLNFQLSRGISMVVTSVQTLQMAIGLLVAAYSVYMISVGGECFVSFWFSYSSLLSYTMLLYLFGNLFLKLYIRKKPGKLD